MRRTLFILVATSLHACASPLTKPSTGNAIQDRYANWPPYDELPLDPTYPTKAAWDVWGAQDSHGALNHITEATVLSAAQTEIRTGLAMNLNLELDIPNPPVNPTRKPLSHLFQSEDGYTDDVLVMNTQLKHPVRRLAPFRLLGSRQHKHISVLQRFDPILRECHWTKFKHGAGYPGSCSEGHCRPRHSLDYARGMDEQGASIDTFTSHTISVADLDAVAESQGLTGQWAQPGDIVLIRTGWVRQYNTLSKGDQQTLPYGSGNWIGVLATDDTARWLWEKKLALVGAENPAFESAPFNGTIDGTPRSLHQIFIGGWGQSIVESLDLEKLSDELHAAGRSTFFLTMQTLNVVSGIASPPNALALL